MIFKINDTQNAALLFEGWEETIIWSCLEGVMGCVYGDHPHQPAAAMAVLGDFAFFAGNPSRELAAWRPGGRIRTFSLLIPQTQAWKDLILDVYQDKASVITRYATVKEPDVFDPLVLREAVTRLPSDIAVRLIDEPLYHMCRSQAWSADLVSQFDTYDAYQRLGLGAAAVRGSVLLAGASSYSRCRAGIEIEVDTHPDFRRQGLARACAAKLIEECLKRGLYPSWDAHTHASLSLAQKLGYHFSHTYEAVEIQNA